MAWYVRKSVKVGLLRFNLSKSGIGTSIGIKGFRVGVRPNGSSYVHTGRYGVYYRKELGNRKNLDVVSIEKSKNKIHTNNTKKYETISTSEIQDSSRTEFVTKLNKSYNSFRFDYLSAILSLISLFISWEYGLYPRIIISSIGILATGYLIYWEIKRRTISILYDFEDNSKIKYEKIIKAFNSIANNNKIWSLIDYRDIFNHESKLNAGASTLINRKLAKAGEGKPPWVNTNIDIPAIITNYKSLYFMPDGILVYDDKGVGFVDFDKITINYNTSRFIEEEKPTKDSSIIDYTWKFANRDGGPDRRFNNNHQIPICLYGELKVGTKKGTLLHIQTSNYKTPELFCKTYMKINNYC